MDEWTDGQISRHRLDKQILFWREIRVLQVLSLNFNNTMQKHSFLKIEKKSRNARFESWMCHCVFRRVYSTFRRNMLPASSVTNQHPMAAWPLKNKTLGTFLTSGTTYQTTSHPRRPPSPTASLWESQIGQEIRDLAMKYSIVTSKVHNIYRLPRNELPHIILPNILA
jgi:hypothetical protein